jgi:hypothetical protein
MHAFVSHPYWYPFGSSTCIAGEEKNWLLFIFPSHKIVVKFSETLLQYAIHVKYSRSAVHLIHTLQYIAGPM